MTAYSALSIMHAHIIILLQRLSWGQENINIMTIEKDSNSNSVWAHLADMFRMPVGIEIFFMYKIKYLI